MSLYKSEQGFVGALNSKYPTPQGMPTASEQLFAQCGLYRTADLKAGIKPAKIRAILDDCSGMSMQPLPLQVIQVSLVL